MGRGWDGQAVKQVGTSKDLRGICNYWKYYGARACGLARQKYKGMEAWRAVNYRFVIIESNREEGMVKGMLWCVVYLGRQTVVAQADRHRLESKGKGSVKGMG